MIVCVDNEQKLDQFVYFVRDLYAGDETFVCPIFFAQKKELSRELLQKKHSTAILCMRDSVVLGRLIFGIGESKQRGEKIGYFSYFDCINDYSVAQELLDYVVNSLKDKATYIEGTFSPFDPDTCRGILVKGYNERHTILTSYNFPYYGEFLEKYGFVKAYDTYAVRIDIDEKNCTLVERVAEMCKLENVRIDALDMRNIDREVDDVHRIFEEATFELNYQEAPSKEMIARVFNSVKMFVEPSLIKIAREENTNRPIGFCLVLKDYNEILKKTNGKINPVVFLANKNKIHGVRGILQYVIPAYQGRGLIGLLYKNLCDSMRTLGITYFEGGTIMEDNIASWKSLTKFGGQISKVYRIYGMELKK